MTKRSNPVCSLTLTSVRLAVPVTPPLASAHWKAATLAGGCGGLTGGGVILGADARCGGVLVVPATGVVEGRAPVSPHALKSMQRPRIAAIRIGQWYCRAPLRPRRGGGTGRRVGLKNRCPQGRSGSTPDLGTKLAVSPP